MAEIVIKVGGMNCGHCKMSVEKALSEVDGVESAVVSLEDANVTVVYDDSKAGVEVLKEAIDDVGFDPE